VNLHWVLQNSWFICSRLVVGSEIKQVSCSYIECCNRISPPWSEDTELRYLNQEPQHRNCVRLCEELCISIFKESSTLHMRKVDNWYLEV